MKPVDLGFKDAGTVLRWQGMGVVQVIPLDKRRMAHSYCQICVIGLEEPDPVVVCNLSWHQAGLVLVPSWDLASNAIPNLSKPSDEVPANAASELLAMRDARVIGEWIKSAGAKLPPIRYWLAAVAAHWAKDRSAALEAIDHYLACKVGPELLEEAGRIRKIMERG